jgi:hypothetical protein
LRVYIYLYVLLSCIQGHERDSLVSAPVVGLVPFTSSRWHSKVSVFAGNCASVKSAFSKTLVSTILLEKYAPTATVFFIKASSMLVSSRDAPRKFAPEKSDPTKLQNECNGDKLRDGVRFRSFLLLRQLTTLCKNGTLVDCFLQNLSLWQ